tara:strand:+ start:184 stop:414 length:231 start_codon:yes stop_codon:yes gene_type:complete
MKQQEMYDYIVSLREYIISLEKRIAILEAKLEPEPMTRAIPGTRKRTFTKAGIESLIEGLHTGGPIRPPSAEDLKF